VLLDGVLLHDIYKYLDKLLMLKFPFKISEVTWLRLLRILKDFPRCGKQHANLKKLPSAVQEGLEAGKLSISRQKIHTLKRDLLLTQKTHVLKHVKSRFTAYSKGARSKTPFTAYSKDTHSKTRFTAYSNELTVPHQSMEQDTRFSLLWSKETQGMLRDRSVQQLQARFFLLVSVK